MRTLLILIAVCLFSLPSVSEAAAYILDGHLATVDTAAQDRKILEVREGKTIYANLPHGYSIAVPPGMVVDVSLSAVRTVFADSQTQVEIYYDDLSGQTASAADYVAYGRRFVDRSGEHRVLQDRVLWHNGLPVHILKWMRRPLKHLPVDRRYYATAEIIKNEREIYTVFIKSAEPIQNELDLINSFRLSEKTGRAGIYLPPQASAGALTPQAQQLMNEYFAVSSPLRWGIFHPNAPDSFRHLDAIEQRLNYRFPFLVRYQSLSDELPVVALHRARREGRYVELTLQTYYYDQDNTAVMYDILDGRFDDYFRQYARDLRDFASPVLFRLNNEMNGDWCWYSAYYTAKDTDIYKAVWRHLHSLFASEGAANVIWVWNPHDRSFPDFAWNHYLAYYPGDDVVDIVGMTGYNTGNYYRGESWREFADIYTPLYREYAVFNKPLMITEFGSNSFGGNKPDWIRRMFREIEDFDKIKVAIWWSGIDWDNSGKPARIYRLDENDAVIEAFSEGLAPYRGR